MTVATDLQSVVADAAAHLYVWALKDIPQDLRDALLAAQQRETSTTGRRVWIDDPRSPLRTAVNQDQNCSGNGRSSPNSRRKDAATCGSKAVSALFNMASTASPGIRRTMKKTRMPTPSTVGTSVSRRACSSLITPPCP